MKSNAFLFAILFTVFSHQIFGMDAHALEQAHWLRLEGNTFFKEKKFGNAIEKYLASYEINPGSVKLLNNLVLAFLSRNGEDDDTKAVSFGIKAVKAALNSVVETDFFASSEKMFDFSKAYILSARAYKNFGSKGMALGKIAELEKWMSNDRFCMMSANHFKEITKAINAIKS